MKTKLAILLPILLALTLAPAGAAVRYVNLANPSPAPPYTNWASAATNIQDAIEAAVAGDEVVVTNGVYAGGAREVYGMSNRVAVTKPVTVQSVNGPEVTLIIGYKVPEMVLGDAAVRCVYLTNGAVLSGFTLTNGATQILSDDPQTSGGGVSCESPGAVVTNCILTGNSASHGGGAFSGTLNKCEFVGNSASYGGGASGGVLNNCTLTGNSANYGSGGGAYSATLNNCTLTENSALSGGGACDSTLNNCMVVGNSVYYDGGGVCGGTLNNCALTGNSAERGGGAAFATLNNCVITGNSASQIRGVASSAGGGVAGGTLNSCTITGNSADYGGGVDAYSLRIGGTIFVTLNNCIVYYNTAHMSGDNYQPNCFSGCINHSCTTPLPEFGIGNITNAPAFIDPGGGDFRLQSDSPCTNAGKNAYAPSGPDFDGNPRIAGGTIDIGAYEFQDPSSTLSYAWLQSFGLPTDGSADFADPDGDQVSNVQEWRAGTDPANALSVLRMVSLERDVEGWRLTWQSVASRTYEVERSPEVSNQGSFVPIANGVFGQDGTTSFLDTSAPHDGSFFYRVRVEQ